MNKVLNNFKDKFKAKVNIIGRKIKENKDKPKKLKHFVVLGVMVVVAVVSTYVNIKSYIKTTTENYKTYNLNNVEQDIVLNNKYNENISTTIPTMKQDIDNLQEKPIYLIAESSIATVYNNSSRKIWPVDGQIIQDYIVDSVVYYPTVGIWKIHPGIDISAKVGENVVNILNGKVTKIYDTEIYGHTVEITNSEYVIKYSGLDNVLSVNVGDNVKAGDKMGMVSSDGNSYETDLGTHIHIEVLKNGEHINPSELLLDS